MLFETCFICALVCKDLWSSFSSCSEWRLNLMMKSIPSHIQNIFYFNRRERETDFSPFSLSIISSNITIVFNCVSFFLSSWSSPGNDTVEQSPLSLCVMTDRLSACDWAEKHKKNFFTFSLLFYNPSMEWQTSDLSFG